MERVGTGGVVNLVLVKEGVFGLLDGSKVVNAVKLRWCLFVVFCFR